MNEEKTTDVKPIKIERDLCIGAGTCVVLAPGTFRMDDENIAVIVDEKGDSPEDILMAAESCPTKAIFIYDTEGNQLYP